MVVKFSQYRRVQFSISPEPGKDSYLIEARYYGKIIKFRTYDSRLYKNLAETGADQDTRYKIYKLIRANWYGAKRYIIL